MAFTMHTHSGQFCLHAADRLEDIVRRAHALGLTAIGLTEHMPRYRARELYPEELAHHGGDADKALAALRETFGEFVGEARRLQGAWRGRMEVLVGMEAEFVDGEYGGWTEGLRGGVDYVVGAVHHVRGWPVDYDMEGLGRAVEACVAARLSLSSSQQTSTEAEAEAEAEMKGYIALCEDYYDLQHQMLLTLRPHIVAHFDLIRLLLPAAFPSPSPTSMDTIWRRITRNLDVAARSGMLLECSAAAVRKGLAEPYPARAVAEAWLAREGRFTLSDDAHAVGHVAAGYAQTGRFLAGLGVDRVWRLRRAEGGGVEEVGADVEDITAAFPLDGVD